MISLPPLPPPLPSPSPSPLPLSIYVCMHTHVHMHTHTHTHTHIHIHIHIHICGGIGIRPYCMYGPQYVCTCIRARRPRQGHCKCTSPTIIWCVATSQGVGRVSLYKVSEARPHSQCVYMMGRERSLYVIVLMYRRSSMSWGYNKGRY